MAFSLDLSVYYVTYILIISIYIDFLFHIRTISSNLSLHIYIYKVFCPDAGPSLDMHYQGSTYLSLLDKRKE